MTAYSQESALIHLKEHWKDVSSSVGFLGYGKIYDYYNGVLSKNQIKRFYHLLKVTHSWLKHIKRNSKYDCGQYRKTLDKVVYYRATEDPNFIISQPLFSTSIKLEEVGRIEVWPHRICQPFGRYLAPEINQDHLEDLWFQK